MSQSDGVLSNFCKHSPKILRRQLIMQLVDQYLGDQNKDANPPTNKFSESTECKPSIQRFHGALLFVDISGFTALSLRLSVEELKNHINEYFTTMLDIVDKFGGDVIKFAGDALFIIWETKVVYNLAADSGELEKSKAEAQAASRNQNSNLSGSSYSGPSDFTIACKIAVDRAVECGREISSVCGNHRVQLTQKASGPAEKITPKSNGMFRGILPAIGTFLSGTPQQTTGSAGTNSACTAAEEEDSVAFLNVHSGVSMGLMAGIDIGANDRWEYFLIGQPLTKVAVAEGLACTGDVVMCPESHAVYHQLHTASTPTSTNKKTFRRVSVDGLKLITKVKESQASLLDKQNTSNVAVGDTLSCGCTKKENGYCRVSTKVTAANANRKSRMKAKIDDSLVFDESLSKEGREVDRIGRDIEEIFEEHKGIINRVLSQQLKILQTTAALSPARSPAITPVNSSRDLLLSKTVDLTAQRQSPSQLTLEDLRAPFTRWMHACLTDDLARHVHDVARNDYIFKDLQRTNVLRQDIDSQFAKMTRKIYHDEKSPHKKPLTIEPISPTAATNNIPTSNGTFSSATSPISPNTGRPVSLSRMQNSRSSGALSIHSAYSGTGSSGALSPLRHKASSRRLLDAEDSANLIAEIRAVTVLFIKVDLPHMELLVDSDRQAARAKHSKFLSKAVNEKLADQLLLDRLQGCIEALSSALSANGGQMRQFIVDDKGTVCIGTFGLRGSVSDDNAAAALETAKMIVDKLQCLSITCSIGVTVGKAYCGLVGSSKRHEYAVMGPSTNLSARLMCKAPPCGIICDIETRNRDRTHAFKTLQNIVAKGYKDPVGTFMPIFTTSSDSNHLQSGSRLMTRASYDYYNGGASNDVDAALKQVNQTLRRELSAALSAAGVSSKNKTFTGVSRILKKMLAANFYLKLDNNIAMSRGSFSQPRVKSKLHGRRSEIESILLFLFASLTEVSKSNGISKTASNTDFFTHGGALSGLNRLQTMSTDSTDGNNNKPVFKTTLPARYVGVIAAQGIGKSALVASIAQQLFTAVGHDNTNHNIHLFKSRYNSFQISLPFNAWKSIIREMLTRVYHTMCLRNIAAGVPSAPSVGGVTSTPTSTTKRRVNRRSLVSGVSHTESDITAGVDFVLSMLGPEMQSLRPLLGDLAIIASDQVAIDALGLSNQEKLAKSLELLRSIVQCYVSITNNLIFITVEDVHAFDLASLSLLHQIWVKNTGIAVIFTGRTQQNSNINQYSPSSPGGGSVFTTGPSPKHRHSLVLSAEEQQQRAAELLLESQSLNFTESFNETDRYLNIDLTKLDKAATSALAVDALSNFGVPGTDLSRNEVIEKIYEVSGGNPMYAFELTKTISQQQQQQQQNAQSASGLDIRELNTTALTAVRCHRIEEVICHRFDQFNNAAQTVLKMASVACSNGAQITLDLLCFVLDDENYDEFTSPSTMTSQKLAAMSFKSRKRNLRPDINVVNALFDILQCEDFIRAVNKSDEAIKHTDSGSCDGSGRTPQNRIKTFSNDFIDVTGRNSSKHRANGVNINSSFSGNQHGVATAAPSMSSETMVEGSDPGLINENNRAHNGHISNNINNINSNSASNVDSSNGNKVHNKHVATPALRMSCDTEISGFASSINSDNKAPTNRNSIQYNSAGNSNSNMNINNNSNVNSNLNSIAPSQSGSGDVVSADQFDNSINLPHLALPPLQPAQPPAQSPPLPALSIDINPIESALQEEQKKVKITKELIASNSYVFEFNIALEQRTIYDLLLDDQKQVIHHCVAEYYESLRHNKQIQSMSAGIDLTNYVQTAEHYCEESFHWQKAGEWSAAMTCSYQAAAIEKNEQKRCEYLDSAYLMFQTLKTTQIADHNLRSASHDQQDHDLLLGDSSASELFFSDVKSLFDAAYSHSKTGSAKDKDAPYNNDSYSMDFPRSGNVMSMESIFQLFSGDSALLETGLRVHVQVALRAITHLQNPEATQVVLENTLQMLLQTKNPFLLSFAHLASMMTSMGQMQLLNKDAADTPTQQPPQAEYFCIGKHEFNELCLPLLSAYVQNYLFFARESDERQQKAMFVVQKLLELSEEETSPIHKIQALSLMIAVLCKIGKEKEAAVLFDELILLYDAKTHSCELAEFYGSDRMPWTLALVSQQEILSGHVEKATKNIDSALSLLNKSLHYATVSLAVARVAATLALQHRYSEASKLFSHYLEVKALAAVECEQIVEDLDRVYAEWLHRLVKYQDFATSGDIALFWDDSSDIDHILMQGGISQTQDIDMFSVDRTLIYDFLCLQGRCLESVFAEMCAVKIAMLCKKSLHMGFTQPELAIYCTTALIYVKHTLSVTCDYGHQFTVNYISALTTVALIIQSLSTLKEKAAADEYISSFLAAFQPGDIALLSDLKKIASEHKFVFASLVVAQFSALLQPAGAHHEAGIAEIFQKIQEGGGEGAANVNRVQELLCLVLPTPATINRN